MVGNGWVLDSFSGSLSGQQPSLNQRDRNQFVHFVLSVLYVPPALCSPGFVLHLLAASLGAVSLVQTQTSFLSLTLLVAGVERERKLKLLLKLYPL